MKRLILVYIFIMTGCNAEDNNDQVICIIENENDGIAINTDNKTVICP